MRVLLAANGEVAQPLAAATALCAAVAAADAGCVTLLLQAKADQGLADPTDPRRRSAAHRGAAIEQSDPRARERLGVLRMLLEKKTGARMPSKTLAVKDADGWSPLLVAASGRLVEVVQLLIGARANVNARSPAGQTALHITRSAGILEELLKHAASLDTRDEKGLAPLHYLLDSPEMVELLLEARAEPNNASMTGVTPLVKLCNNLLADPTAPDVAKMLLAWGAATDVKPREGLPAIFGCCETGNAELLRTLGEYDSKLLEHKDQTSKRTLLHMAGSAAVVRTLVDLDADVHAPDRFKNTPLHVALLHGRPEVVGALLAAGADPFEANAHGVEALNVCRTQECWQVLLEDERVRAVKA